jgi:hypothetical protein
MARPLCELPGCALPIQLAPRVDALDDRTRAFGVNLIVPVMDRGSLELAVQRAPYIDFSVARFGAQPPTRESTGAVEAMPFYAGQSAGAGRAIQPAAEIMAELAAGLPTRA